MRLSRPPESRLSLSRVRRLRPGRRSGLEAAVNEPQGPEIPRQEPQRRLKVGRTVVHRSGSLTLIVNSIWRVHPSGLVRSRLTARSAPATARQMPRKSQAMLSTFGP